MVVAHNIGIQMNRKELTKTFSMIFQGEKTFVLHGHNSRLGVDEDDLMWLKN